MTYTDAERAVCLILCDDKDEAPCFDYDDEPCLLCQDLVKAIHGIKRPASNNGDKK